MDEQIVNRLEAIGKTLSRLGELAEKGDLPGHPFRGNQHSGGGGGGSHDVPLPKNPKKLNMDTAARALNQMGFEMKPAGFNIQSRQAEYELTGPDGKVERKTSQEIKDLVYAGQKK